MGCVEAPRLAVEKIALYQDPLRMNWFTIDAPKVWFSCSWPSY